MKYAFVFLIGVVLGSVVAVATTTFLAPHAPAPSAAASKKEAAEGVAKSIEDAVARALKRVQSEAVAARESMSAPGESDAAPPSRSKSARQRTVSADPPPDEPDVAVADDGGAVTRTAATPLREKDVARVERLIVRTAEERTARRKEWLLLTESAVAGALGAPDRIAATENGGETWTYEVEFTNRNGAAEEGELQLTFSRGRVIRITGADDIPE